MPSSIRSHFRRGALSAQKPAPKPFHQVLAEARAPSHTGKKSTSAKSSPATPAETATRELIAQLDANALWEKVEPLVLAGADLSVVGTNGKAIWNALSRLMILWDNDSFNHGGCYHWTHVDSEYRVRYLEEKMRLLIKHGAPIDGLCQSDDWGKGTFLHHLCSVGRRLNVSAIFAPLVQLALEHGADPDAMLGFQSPRGRAQHSPLLLDVFSAHDARQEARQIGLSMGLLPQASATSPRLSEGGAATQAAVNGPDLGPETRPADEPAKKRSIRL